MTSPATPDAPHRRRDPLTGRWVLVSPQRALRPWQGAQDAAPPAPEIAYDAGCYLCAGNARAGGQRNPAYTGVHVFDNDFPALLAAAPEADAGIEDPLFRAEPVQGRCRVLCYSPHHSRTLAGLSRPETEQVVEAWCEQAAELGRTHRWVQVFENKGAMMGCSSPHPHGQIWATQHLPGEAALEDRHQRAYTRRHGRRLLLDVAERELALGERIVLAADGWLALVPYWATWPFETLLLPLAPTARLPDLDAAQRRGLAAMLGRLLPAYDRLFDCPFPYSMGWHGAPFDGAASPSAGAWQLHAHFYPPLLRSAGVRKFMVGFEMLAEAQRDLTAEQAAERLRAALR